MFLVSVLVLSYYSAHKCAALILRMFARVAFALLMYTISIVRSAHSIIVLALSCSVCVCRILVTTFLVYSCYYSLRSTMIVRCTHIIVPCPCPCPCLVTTFLRLTCPRPRLMCGTFGPNDVPMMDLKVHMCGPFL
jgi:hypothetical protein